MSAPTPIRQTPPRPGRIERFDRPFDQATDEGALASALFRELSTGDWGIRYYAPVPGKRPEAVVVRVSNELQTQGDKVPFADQVKRILTQWPPDAYVHAIYWDCQTAKDTRKKNRYIEQIIRPGFERCIDEAVGGAFGTIRVFRSCRIMRSLYGATRLEHAYKVAGVVAFSATDTIPLDLLGVIGSINAKDADNIFERTFTGRERVAVRDGLPPTGEHPMGWRIARGAPNTLPRWWIEHDPEAMPVLRRLLAGLRFEGWTWGDGAAHLTASGLRRRRLPERPWEDTIVRAMVLRHRWWLGTAVVHLPGFSAVTGRRSQLDADRQEVTVAVPPVTIDDPATGSARPITEDDLVTIRASARARPARTSTGRAPRPLAGLLHCVCCEWTLFARRLPEKKTTTRTLADGTRKRYTVAVRDPKWVYECHWAGARRKVGKAPCERRPRRLREDHLLQDIWEALLERLGRPEWATEEARRAVESLRRDPQAVAAADAGGRLERLAREEVTWFGRYDRGECSRAALELRLADLRQERQAVEQLVADGAAQAEALRRREAEYTAARAAAGAVDWPRLTQYLRTAPAADRAELLRTLLQRVLVHADRRLVLEVKWAGVSRVVGAAAAATMSIVSPSAAPTMTGAGPVFRIRREC